MDLLWIKAERIAMSRKNSPGDCKAYFDFGCSAPMDFCEIVEKTKIEEISRNCVFIVQGNEYTSREFVIATLEKLIIMIKLYCQGDETILYKPIN